ncbi:hypothetical protein [Streptomyces sp. NPDC047999]|uniref:hypothetical protein n=1 Tax=Streptomyces sp. NPDC047999 TaxID=3365497 RepID=UPI00371A15B9
MRRLRFNGTGSGVNGCPSLHEDLDSGEVIVHGPPLTDPADIARLRRLGEGEVPIVVPRELLVGWGPKDMTREAKTIGMNGFGRLFTQFEGTRRTEREVRQLTDNLTKSQAAARAAHLVPMS